MIIGETSGLRIVTESKGMLGVNLRAEGHGAHSAYQWLGHNALVALMRSVERLLARYPIATAEEWRTTVNLARVHTPNQARNQIPAQAEAWLDIRFPPEDRDLAGRTADEIAAYLQEFCEPGVTAVVQNLDAPHHTDPGRPEIARLQAAARDQGFSPISCASTARVTGASTVAWTSRRWRSAWAGRVSTARASTPRSARSRRTTRRCGSSWPA